MTSSPKHVNRRKLGTAITFLVIAGMVLWLIILRGPTTPKDAVLDLERSLKSGKPSELFEIYNGPTKIQGQQLNRLYSEVVAPYFAGATFTSTELRDGSGQTGMVVRFRSREGQERVYSNSAMESDAGGATTYISFITSLWYSVAPISKTAWTPLERMKMELRGAERDGSNLEGMGLPPPIRSDSVKNWHEYKSLLRTEITRREDDRKSGAPE